MNINAQNYLTISLGKRNAVDFTLAGSGIFASVNYNRIVYVSKSYFVNTSAGIGVVPFFLGSVFPHQASINIGKKRDFLEIGIGGSYFFGKSDGAAMTTSAFSYNFVPSIGYRKHIGTNYVFRVYGMAFMHLAGEYFMDDYPIVPWVGLSFGYRF